MCYLCRQIARTTWSTVGLLNWGDQFQFFFLFLQLHSKVRSICQRNTSQIISLCTVATSQEEAYQICLTIATFARDVFFVNDATPTHPPPPRQPPSPPSNNPRPLLCNNPWKQQWTIGKKYEYNYIYKEQNKTHKKEITRSETRGRTRTCTLTRTRISTLRFHECLCSVVLFRYWSLSVISKPHEFAFQVHFLC